MIRRGLTLVEAVVALAITALLLAGVAGVASSTLDVRRRLEERTRRAEGRRAAGDLMAADLRMAVLPARPRGRPLLVRGAEGYSEGLADGELLRVLTGHAVDWSGGGVPPSGAAWVSWRLVGADDGSRDLVREQRPLGDPDAEPADRPPGDRLVVCRRVGSVELRALRSEDEDRWAGVRYPAALELDLDADGRPQPRRLLALPTLTDRPVEVFRDPSRPR